MLNIMRETPVWVYAVFFLILYYGIMACFPSNETRRSLLFSPFVFFVWSLVSVINSADTLLPVCSWAIGAVIGIVIAYFMFDYRGVSVGDQAQSISIPGSPKILIISLIFFCVKYYIGYEQATDPAFANTLNVLLLASFASGIAIGLLGGRAWKLIHILNSLCRRIGVYQPTDNLDGQSNKSS